MLPSTSSPLHLLHALFSTTLTFPLLTQSLTIFSFPPAVALSSPPPPPPPFFPSSLSIKNACLFSPCSVLQIYFGPVPVSTAECAWWLSPSPHSPPPTSLPPSTFHWPESFSSWSSPPFSFDHFFPRGRSVPASADLCTLLLFIYLLALSVHPSLHPRSFSRGIFSTFSASLLGFISGGVRGLSWRGCAGVTATVQL